MADLARLLTFGPTPNLTLRVEQEYRLSSASLSPSTPSSPTSSVYSYDSDALPTKPGIAVTHYPPTPPPKDPPRNAGNDPAKPPPETGTVPPPYTAFSPWRQRFILTVVAVAGCFGPLAGNIYLPALPILEREFGVGATAVNLTVSVFMLTFAFAPLFWSSFADWKGRRPLYIISIAIYIVANILLATVTVHYGVLLFLRIVQAFGSAAVVSMGAGTVADIFPPKKRAFAMSVFLIGPQCGPVLGPVLGGALAGEADWRWIFGFLAIAGFALWLLIIFALPETLRARVGDGRMFASSGPLLLPPTFFSPLAPESERGPAPPKPTLLGYWRMFRYPPIGIVSLNTALLYSTYFAISVQLPADLTGVYGWSTAAVGGGFVAVGVAMIVGSMCGGRFFDWRRARMLRASPDGKVDPEKRLQGQIWGVLVCASGCLMYGWFVERAVHPAGVIIATFLTGFGMNWVFVGTTVFLTECVPQQAAGAFALGNMLRNPGAAVAAVLVPTLVSKMGSGWCFTGLALFDLVFVGAAVTVLQVKSPEWRAARAAKVAAAGKPGGK